ncbi:MAG: cation-translocating P-type ATPase [Acidimicrobiia bacterium]|nr:cation-translocating P-type ATPase [Acidimicrobiia bacterium]
MSTPPLPTALSAPWAVEADAVVAALATDAVRGLEPDDADARLHSSGRNELDEQAGRSRFRLFLAQFTNTMTVVLGVAAVVTLVIGDLIDTVAIASILLLNAIVGYLQEHRAEQAMAALKRMTTTSAVIVRSGVRREIPSAEVVAGDVVLLAVGDVVPADVRLIEVQGLRVNEATLTGESEPSAKTAKALPDADVSMTAERHNVAFKGTGVTYGRAQGVVIATGMNTEVGQIAQLLQAHATRGTPLQRRLAVLGRQLAFAAMVVVAVIFVVGVVGGEPADTMLLTAVSLAVAAIPEGLPAVVTVSLALGARRMADRSALIRRLPAVETLGSVSVICTDKTGTLTENRMLAERVWTPVGRYEVGGSGYEPYGEVSGGPPPADDAFLQRLARVAAACNDALLHAPRDAHGAWTLTGDPTEGAFLALAGKFGIERSELDEVLPRRAEIGFDAERRRMVTIHADGDGSWVAVKGALDAIAPLLHRDDVGRLAEAEVEAEQWASDGYRVLAVADRRVAAHPEDVGNPEHELRLVGIVGIADPPRPEARDAIALCRDAGIAAVMITGDHPRTAAAIGARLGLEDHDQLMTGAEVDALDDAAFAARVRDVRIFARTNPEQKLRIVNAWRSSGAIVAMTGDGVNDAPALRAADIGVAMGLVGTEVSKEAADMVLADDNFATIVHAVEEGRRIYDNIRRFVRYLLTTNTGEILIMFLAPLLGLPLPLLPLQILWVNLVTDGLPAVALGLEPTEPHTMQRRPRDPQESVLAGGLWQHAVWVGALMAGVVIPLQAIARHAGMPWQTMTFATVAFLQLGHAFAVRSERRSVFQLGIRSNPYIAGAIALSIVAQLAVIYVPGFRSVFDTEPLSLFELSIVAVVSTAALVAVEIEKLVRRRRAP